MQIIFVLIIFLSCNGKSTKSDSIYYNTDGNPNEISNYYKAAIESGEINHLSLLETIEKEKYDIIANHIFNRNENELIENYYYAMGFNHEYEDRNIEYVYEIFYHEILFNKYRSYRGDPTGKCFSIVFNENHDFLRVEYWR